jgi:hypothetical protein
VVHRASRSTVDLRAATETNSTPGKSHGCYIFVRLLSLFVLPITIPTPAFPLKTVDHNEDIRYETLRRLFSGYPPRERASVALKDVPIIAHFEN